MRDNLCLMKALSVVCYRSLAWLNLTNIGQAQKCWPTPATSLRKNWIFMNNTYHRPEHGRPCIQSMWPMIASTSSRGGWLCCSHLGGHVWNWVKRWQVRRRSSHWILTSSLLPTHTYFGLSHVSQVIWKWRKTFDLRLSEWGYQK